MKRTLSGLAAIAAAGLTWGLIERRWFALRHQTIPALSSAATASALRVLHLSDLHLRPGDRRMRRFVLRSLSRGPDLVVVTGDILGHPDAVDDAIDLLGDVVAGRSGVAVLGSNDRFGPTLKNPLRYFRGPSSVAEGVRLDTDRLVVGLKEAGWHVLCNERITLETAAGRIDVVGLDDPHIGAASPAQVDWSAPTTPASLRLGVVHAPYVGVLDHFAQAGFDLVLTGHTHGGQVRVPGIGALVNNCDLPLPMSRGLSRYPTSSSEAAGHMNGDRPWLHVSAGLGTSLYAPVRFACRPELSVLDLVEQLPGL